jgi:hypothetical protein
LRELGRGLTAAWSTWAVAARNFGFAFILVPFGGITRIRFNGSLSPGAPFERS